MQIIMVVTKSLQTTNIWFVSMAKICKKKIMFLSFKIQANNVCIVTQISEPPSSYIQAFINFLFWLNKYHNFSATSFTLNLP